MRAIILRRVFLRGCVGLVCSGCFGLVPAAHATTFADPYGEGWQFSRENNHCELSRTIRGFGTARFYGPRGGVLQFEVSALRDVFAPGDVAVEIEAPQWHAAYPLRAARGTLHALDGGAIGVPDPEATRLLMDLREGFIARVSHAAWYDEGVVGVGQRTAQPPAVEISPVYLREAYAAFARCFHWPMPARFDEVERTRLSFASDSHSLKSASRKRLKLLADYLKRDDTVQRVYIDGHTDGSGGERHNARLARQRAEVVANILQSQGVARERLIVRHHGARYPVADNATAEGRAANRRTTVRLERSQSQVAQVSSGNHD